MSLLPEQEVVSEREETDTPKCGGLCQLNKQGTTNKKKPYGSGRHPVLFILESPVDDAGLKVMVKLAGMELSDCCVTHAVRCRPPHNDPPEKKEIQYCRSFLKQVLHKQTPSIIIPVGGPACQSIIGFETSDNEKVKPGNINVWAGWQIPSRTFNAYICPIYDPINFYRTKDEAVKNIIVQQLKEAFKLSRPYEEDEIDANLEDEVEIIKEREALARIKDTIRRKEAVAFDYETTGLKPEEDYQKIVSCSIAGHEECYAWKICGSAGMKAVKRLVLSGLPKIASNSKFEERWTIKKLGVNVRNWHWDTMLAAHILNNRSLTSIKFLAYAMKGILPYDDHISKFLSASRPNDKNNIHKLDDRDLLLYNGIDSYLEYHIAMEQMHLIGYPLGEL